MGDVDLWVQRDRIDDVMSLLEVLETSVRSLPAIESE